MQLLSLEHEVQHVFIQVAYDDGYTAGRLLFRFPDHKVGLVLSLLLQCKTNTDWPVS